MAGDTGDQHGVGAALVVVVRGGSGGVGEILAVISGDAIDIVRGTAVGVPAVDGGQVVGEILGEVGLEAEEVVVSSHAAVGHAEDTAVSLGGTVGIFRSDHLAVAAGTGAVASHSARGDGLPAHCREVELAAGHRGGDDTLADVAVAGAFVVHGQQVDMRALEFVDDGVDGDGHLHVANISAAGIILGQREADVADDGAGKLVGVGEVEVDLRHTGLAHVRCLVGSAGGVVAVGRDGGAVAGGEACAGHDHQAEVVVGRSHDAASVDTGGACDIVGMLFGSLSSGGTIPGVGVQVVPGDSGLPGGVDEFHSALGSINDDAAVELIVVACLGDGGQLKGSLGDGQVVSSSGAAAMFADEQTVDVGVSSHIGEGVDLLCHCRASLAEGPETIVEGGPADLVVGRGIVLVVAGRHIATLVAGRVGGDELGFVTLVADDVGPTIHVTIGAVTHHADVGAVEHIDHRVGVVVDGELVADVAVGAAGGHRAADDGAGGIDEVQHVDIVDRLLDGDVVEALGGEVADAVDGIAGGGVGRGSVDGTLIEDGGVLEREVVGTLDRLDLLGGAVAAVHRAVVAEGDVAHDVAAVGGGAGADDALGDVEDRSGGGVVAVTVDQDTALAAVVAFGAFEVGLGAGLTPVGTSEDGGVEDELSGDETIAAVSLTVACGGSVEGGLIVGKRTAAVGVGPDGRGVDGINTDVDVGGAVDVAQEAAAVGVGHEGAAGEVEDRRRHGVGHVAFAVVAEAIVDVLCAAVDRLADGTTVHVDLLDGVGDLAAALGAGAAGVDIVHVFTTVDVHQDVGIVGGAAGCVSHEFAVGAESLAGFGVVVHLEGGSHATAAVEVLSDLDIVVGSDIEGDVLDIRHLIVGAAIVVVAVAAAVDVAVAAIVDMHIGGLDIAGVVVATIEVGHLAGAVHDDGGLLDDVGAPAAAIESVEALVPSGIDGEFGHVDIAALTAGIGFST